MLSLFTRIATPSSQTHSIKASGPADEPGRPRPGPQRPSLRRSLSLRKIDKITGEDISRSVHAVILAGGPSDNPLARTRAMPAVELGGHTLSGWRMLFGRCGLWQEEGMCLCSNLSMR